MVFQIDIAGGGRFRLHLVGSGKADIIALDPGGGCQIGSPHVEQFFDRIVPGVRRLANRQPRPARPAFRPARRPPKRGNFDRHRRGEVARLLLPAVHGADGAVAHQILGSPTDHRPEPRHALIIERALAPREAHMQNDEGGFIELDSIPVMQPVEEHVLRPVAIGILRDLKIEQHATGVFVLLDGQQRADRLDHVARPDQVVTPVGVAFRGSPRHGQAGHHRSRKILRFVRPHHRGANPVHVLRMFLEPARWSNPCLPESCHLPMYSSRAESNPCSRAGPPPDGRPRLHRGQSRAPARICPPRLPGPPRRSGRHCLRPRPADTTTPFACAAKRLANRRRRRHIRPSCRHGAEQARASTIPLRRANSIGTPLKSPTQAVLPAP